MSDFLSDLVGDDRSSLEQKKRVNRAREDFGFFCQYYLPDYFFTDPADYQKILYDVADTRSLSEDTSNRLKPFINERYHSLLRPTEKLVGAMFVEPREHGKTVRWSFAYVLWSIVTGKNRYALLIGASGDAARENLINIKIELEENELLLNDFMDLKGNVWRDDRIELKNDTCIQAKGSGASMRGTRFRQYRPDLIILDDVLKDDAVDSPSQRDKISRWLKRVVFNLGKTAFVIWVNTIFHSDDPISRLIAEVEVGTLKRWIAVRLSCLRPDGTPLWPEYWSAEALEEKREQLGFDSFSTEWMNEPLSDEQRIIQRSWIKNHEYRELPPANELRYFNGVDPATGKHDRTAEIPIAVHRKTGIIYVLLPWAKVCSETATVRQLIITHRLYGYELIAWEDVVFSGIYGNYVQKMAAEENVYLPIKKLSNSLSKDAKARFLSPLIENGIIRFPADGAEDMINELVNFPKWKFDDQMDGLYLAVKVIPSGSGSPVVEQVKITANTAAQKIINMVRRW
jgi:predicted phage terminase large subunit-like protein